MTFKTLSPEEYERLPLKERMEYLQRLMDDIAEKMAEARRQLDETKSGLNRGSAPRQTP